MAGIGKRNLPGEGRAAADPADWPAPRRGNGGPVGRNRFQGGPLDNPRGSNEKRTDERGSAEPTGGPTSGEATRSTRSAETTARATRRPRRGGPVRVPESPAEETRRSTHPAHSESRREDSPNPQARTLLRTRSAPDLRHAARADAGSESCDRPPPE